MTWGLTVVGVRPVPGQKGKSTARNKIVKNNIQTSDELLSIIISFLLSALNIFVFIPNGLHHSFSLGTEDI